MEIEQHPLVVRFSCRRCGWQWRESFELVRWSDYDGDDFEAYFHRGVPVPSPALGRRCAACGGLRVDWTDVAFLPRRRAVTEWPAGPAGSAQPVRPEPKAPTLRWLTRAAHQRQPMTRRFP
ncbi:hypothetical protein [Pseudofrankia inefficax]|uniref:Uncharacterized protein n=1 Tax=Pseudofrankia inefficax (strain DSM 45817 / CECT 9037 / DDB 130130 / EuI1c) TaxID=298654 RepID=E3IZC9_PSEI1|nr:hypothetical protein [Pseudofrankia inefficax]ADP81556.1 hypothetical protein FraEuI1c_3549 [Pseudofrankia inefficax]